MAELGKRSSVAVSWIGKVKPLPRWWRWPGCCGVRTFGLIRRYCTFLCGCGTDSVVNVAYLSAARADLLDQ